MSHNAGVVHASSEPAKSMAVALLLEGLAARIDAALPQTQCTRCGYVDCAHYAQAIASGDAGIDQQRLAEGT